MIPLEQLSLKDAGKEITMRPQSFYQQVPQGRPFNHFPGPMPGPGRGPMPNFGQQMPRGFQPGMMPPPGPMPGPGLGSGTIPGFAPKTSTPKLESFMDTANKFLATAQSFQPLIQQATPMIRNLPALWKLYKGFQSMPSSNETEPKQERKGSKRDSFDSISTSSRSKKVSPEKLATRPSKPLIYQPPYDF
ncbi:hypothetical protein EC501_12045 [Lysinibacillus halotolerans]|uniref:4-hydroxy-3-methylbut-2-enyl diphosphate reductase n=2 Tax=Bacilli TaxID=91061 RepID=A0A3M8H736_9BACI|nr:hypothetical protein EC501_12045 [Lysinibacillus halotolerans]